MGQYLEQQIGFSGNRRDPTGVWGFIPARSSSAMDKNLAGHIRLTEWELIFLIGNSTGAEGGLCSQWINYGSLGFPEGVDVGVFSGIAGKYPYISVAPRHSQRPYIICQCLPREARYMTNWSSPSNPSVLLIFSSS